MEKHVLVTGGAGYIGSHACKALKAAGFLQATVAYGLARPELRDEFAAFLTGVTTGMKFPK